MKKIFFGLLVCVSGSAFGMEPDKKREEKDFSEQLAQFPEAFRSCMPEYKEYLKAIGYPFEDEFSRMQFMKYKILCGMNDLSKAAAELAIDSNKLAQFRCYDDQVLQAYQEKSSQIDSLAEKARVLLAQKINCESYCIIMRAQREVELSKYQRKNRLFEEYCRQSKESAEKESKL